MLNPTAWVRKEAINVRSTMSDDKFFKSAAVHHMFQVIADGVTKRWSRRPRVVFGHDDQIAWTNDNIIHISTNAPMAKDMPRYDRFRFLLGSLIHECAHILFTDFVLNHDLNVKFLDKGEFIPEPTEDMMEKYEEFKTLLSSVPNGARSFRASLMSIYHEMFNSIEDGAVDRMVQEAVPGYGQYDEYVRDIIYEDAVDFMAGEEFLDMPPRIRMLNYIFIQGKYYTSEDIEIDEELSDLFEMMIPYIDEASQTDSAIWRSRNVSSLFLLYFDAFLKDMLEEAIEASKKEDKGEEGGEESSEGEGSSSASGDGSASGSGKSSSSSGKPSSDDLLKKALSEIAGTKRTKSSKEASAPTGRTRSVLGDSKKGDAGKKKSESSGASPDKTSDSSSSGASDEDRTSRTGSKPAGTKGGSGKREEGAKGSSSSTDKTTSSAESESEETAKEEGESKVSDTETETGEGDEESSESGATSGSDASDDEGEGDADDGASSEKFTKDLLEKLEKEAAEDVAKERCEEKLAEEAEEELRSIPSSEMHRRLTSKLDRVDPYEGGDGEIDPKIFAASRRIQRGMRQIFEDMVLGATDRKLYVGKKFDGRNMYRNDGRHMMTKKSPEDTPDIAVELLVDESGSMCGERIEAARNTAYVVYDFCRGMNIPVAIHGHTENYDSCHTEHITCYAEFDSVDNKDILRLARIDAKNNNRDGYAIRFAAKHLENRPEKVKLLMIISDGLPLAVNYSGPSAAQDVRDAVAEARKKDIFVITAGIGESREAIKNVYITDQPTRCARFLDISDLDEMPKQFIQIIKKHMDV